MAGFLKYLFNCIHYFTNQGEHPWRISRIVVQWRMYNVRRTLSLIVTGKLFCPRGCNRVKANVICLYCRSCELLRWSNGCISFVWWCCHIYWCRWRGLSIVLLQISCWDQTYGLVDNQKNLGFKPRLTVSLHWVLSTNVLF